MSSFKSKHIFEDFLDTPGVIQQIDNQDEVNRNDYFIVEFSWDYSKDKLARLESFDYERFLRFISIRVRALPVLDVMRDYTTEVCVMARHEKPSNEDFEVVRHNQSILEVIKRQDASIPDSQINYRSKFNINIRLVFGIISVIDCGFERFARSFTELSGSMRVLLKYGSVIMPYESLAERSAGIYVDIDNNVKSIGGFSGMHITGWNRKTFKRLYGFLTGNEPEEKEGDRKHSLNSAADMPRLYKILYEMRFDRSPDAEYKFSLVGYDVYNTFNKTIYAYMIPKNPQKDGDFFKMCRWLEEHFINRMNRYDEYEIILNNSNVTITLKISCNGFRPVRNDGKKKLEYVVEHPGITYKIVFCDAQWNRFNQATTNSQFSNSSANMIRANLDYIKDMKNGLFGAHAKRTAKEEGDLKSMI